MFTEQLTTSRHLPTNLQTTQNTKKLICIESIGLDSNNRHAEGRPSMPFTGEDPALDQSPGNRTESRERSAFHHVPRAFAHKKTGYICADQPVIHFSLAVRRRTIHSEMSTTRPRPHF